MRQTIENFPDNDLKIIQGGMGVGVSSPELAGKVAQEHATGIVSGTATSILLARLLQDGNRDALEAVESYPIPEIADGIISKYYLENGRQGQPYKSVPMFVYEPNEKAADLAVVGAYSEVWQARKIAGQSGHIGINLLTKIEEPTVHTIYGAMQAGVEVITMGAGIPAKIPMIIGMLASSKTVSYPISVSDAEHGQYSVNFDSQRYNTSKREVMIPRFLAIITSDILATRLNNEKVPPDGFIIEEPNAGGHNAPPRRKNIFDEKGQPVYDARDYANFDKIKKLDVPFWLAGSYGNREGYERAQKLGATGIQAGSIFALVNESRLDSNIKQGVIDKIISGDDVEVFTSHLASPTGFPFKVLEHPGTLSDRAIYEERKRVCDLGFLRQAVEIDYLDPQTGQLSKKIVNRCPAERVEDFVKKGGDMEDTYGRVCICNALVSAIRLGQMRSNDYYEPPIVTIGDNVNQDVREVAQNIGLPLTAAGVIKSIRGSQTT